MGNPDLAQFSPAGAAAGKAISLQHANKYKTNGVQPCKERGEQMLENMRSEAEL